MDVYPIVVPNSVALQNLRFFLEQNDYFVCEPGDAQPIYFHPMWAHLEPVALAMLSAWGAWCTRNHVIVSMETASRAAEYAWRMKLFDHLNVDYRSTREVHEEAGRFIPVTQVRTNDQAKAVIGDISALLHLQDDPDSLAAVQYCVSELIRNVLEHSASPDGAFVCAQNYTNAKPARVSLAVADCGVGIATHLGQRYKEAQGDDREAVLLALRPGITGAIPGMYGTSDNAGAGLFFTRALAKGTGGYFFLGSGTAGYRLRRYKDPMRHAAVYIDPRSDKHDLWDLPHSWQGTVAALELGTDRITDFNKYISWIRAQLPQRTSRRKVRFT